MNKFAISIFVVAIFTQGCANRPVEVAAPAAVQGSTTTLPPAPISITQSEVKAGLVPRTTPLPELTHSYARIVGKKKFDTAFHGGPVKEDLLEILGGNLKNFLLSSQATFIIFAQPFGLGSEGPLKQQVLHVHKNRDIEEVDIRDVVFTPYFDPNPDIQIQLQKTQSSSTNSEVVSAALTAFRAAAELSSGAGVLAKFLSRNYSAEATSIDDRIEQLLKTSNTSSPKYYAFDINENQQLDIWVERENNKNKNQILMSLQYQVIESLISNGDKGKIPEDPSVIKSFKIATKPSIVTIRSAIEADQDYLKAKDTVSMQKFCSGLDGKFDQLGLKKFDRLAVAYAYLKDSKWNSTLSFRPEEDDQCAFLVKELEATLPHLKLNSSESLAKSKDASRASLIDKYKQTIWPDLHIAIETKKPEKWLSMLADRVKISATTEVPIGDSLSIPIGETEMSKDQLVQVLTNSSLSHQESPFGCYSLKASAKKFETSCIQSIIGGKPIKMMVEFSVANAYKADDGYPSLVSISFTLK